jgi:hypothetical protein
MGKSKKKRLIEEEFTERLAGFKGEAMQTGIFYVKLRNDLKKDFKDFFPHMSSNYISISHMFSKDKLYPVLAVEKVVVFDQEGRETASARFLVPTENMNFIWVHSELFHFAEVEEK